MACGRRGLQRGDLRLRGGLRGRGGLRYKGHRLLLYRFLRRLRLCLRLLGYWRHIVPGDQDLALIDLPGLRGDLRAVQGDRAVDDRVPLQLEAGQAGGAGDVPHAALLHGQPDPIGGVKAVVHHPVHVPIVLPGLVPALHGAGDDVAGEGGICQLHHHPPLVVLVADVPGLQMGVHRLHLIPVPGGEEIAHGVGVEHRMDQGVVVGLHLRIVQNDVRGGGPDQNVGAGHIVDVGAHGLPVVIIVLGGLKLLRGADAGVPGGEGAAVRRPQALAHHVRGVDHDRVPAAHDGALRLRLRALQVGQHLRLRVQGGHGVDLSRFGDDRSDLRGGKPGAVEPHPAVGVGIGAVPAVLGDAVGVVGVQVQAASHGGIRGQGRPALGGAGGIEVIGLCGPDGEIRPGGAGDQQRRVGEGLRDLQRVLVGAGGLDQGIVDHQGGVIVGGGDIPGRPIHDQVGIGDVDRGSVVQIHRRAPGFLPGGGAPHAQPDGGLFQPDHRFRSGDHQAVEGIRSAGELQALQDERSAVLREVSRIGPRVVFRIRVLPAVGDHNGRLPGSAVASPGRAARSAAGRRGTHHAAHALRGHHVPRQDRSCQEHRQTQPQSQGSPSFHIHSALSFSPGIRNSRFLPLYTRGGKTQGPLFTGGYDLCSFSQVRREMIYRGRPLVSR